MVSSPEEKKLAVVAAYNQLSKALLQTSAAVSDFATALAGTNDPQEALTIMSNLPVLPGLSAETGAGDKAPEEDSKKKAKKPKKIKDPNAPKRPPSAYIEFQNAVRVQYRETDPEMPYSEVLRKIAAVWSEMGEEDKQKWHAITAAKGKEFEEAKVKYAAEHPNAYVPPEPSTSGGDILVSGSGTSLTKDGKEYTGKKRGRKSAAERAALGLDPLPTKKEREAAKAAAQEAAGAAGTADKATLEAIAKAVEGVPKEEESKKEKKKSEKKKAEAAAAAAAVPAPVVAAPPKAPTPSTSSDEDSSEEESSSSEEDDDDDDDSSDESSDESADEPTPPPAPVATPKSNGKNKRKDAVVPTSTEKAKKKSKKE